MSRMDLALRISALALSALALAGCSHAKPESPWRLVGRELSGLLKEPYSDSRGIEVAYLTNREAGPDGPGCSDRNFGVAPSPAGALAYGTCTINVPKTHFVGRIDSAETIDSDRYFRALAHSVQSEESFRASLQGADPVLVFIHGFNVRFEQAVFRAAQIAYDLKFQGKVVLFSWPSGARAGIFDSTLINRTYTNNRRSAAATLPLATSFFKMLAASGARIHMLIHSMGHQVAIPALTVATAGPTELPSPFIQELILNAPDYDVDEFLRETSALKKAAARVTLYCSPNDTAISVSQSYNSGGRRLGGCESFPGMDVINVADIDTSALGDRLGHGYYSSRAILTDVYQVLLGLEADKRLFIRKSEPGRVENYFLRP